MISNGFGGLGIWIGKLTGGRAEMQEVLIRITALAFVIVAGGCAGKAPPQQLAQACEVKECTCFDTSMAWWRKAATSKPLWSPEGRAYCPEGQELRLTESEQ
jgi:hypothetical protein